MTLNEKREEKLRKVLKSLGNGKNKIAKFLEKKKIKGTCYNHDDCPIAKYVKKQFKKNRRVAVSDYSVKMWFLDGDYIHISMPKAVADFVEAFDLCEYDFLVER